MSLLYTSSSDTVSCDIKRFILRIAYFAAPLLLAFLLLESILVLQGETIPIRWLVWRDRECSEPPILKRKYFSQQFNLYHIMMIRQRKPDILAVGSSRIGSMRSRMFFPIGQNFYKAPNLIHSIGDICRISDMICNGSLPAPKVLIIGLDHWILSPYMTKETWITEKRDVVFSFATHVVAMRNLASDLFRGNGLSKKPPPAYLLDPAGTNPPLIEPLREFQFESYEDREMPPVIERVRNHLGRFRPFKRLDRISLRLLISACRALSYKGVEVFIIEPPVSTEVYDALSSMPEHISWWNEYRDELVYKLNSEGFIAISAVCPRILGLSDRANMYDGFHCGPFMMSYLLERLVVKVPDTSILKGVDLDHLRSLRKMDSLTVAVQ